MTHFTPQPRHIDRESARETITRNLASQRQLLADMEAEAHVSPRLRKHFASIDPRLIIADAAHRLRFIDCAPEGANHQVAMMQDKTGTPTGMAFNENVGPGPAVRSVGDRKYGGWIQAKIRQHEARLARQS